MIMKSVIFKSAAACGAAILLCAGPGCGQTIQSVLNAASFTTNFAPGTWVAIFGTNLAPAAVAAQSAPFSTQLGGVSVTAAGLAARLSYVSASQINALIPFEVPGSPYYAVPVVVTTPTGSSQPFHIVLWRSAPAIFTKDSSGTGAALAFDGSFNPLTTLGTAPLVLYATGLGPTDPPASTSSLGAGMEPLNRVQDHVAVAIGNSNATVLYAGLAPGLHGIYQLNVVPPPSILGNSLAIKVDGISGATLTLPVPAGTNVANVTGSIDGLYPAAGPIASQLTFSALLMAGAISTTFDILPDAKPFRIVAQASIAVASSIILLNFAPPVATAVISIDPPQNSWQATCTVPTALTRQFNFSNAGFAVLSFPTNAPFPGDVVPASLNDPIAANAIARLPLPTSSPAIGANATFTASGSIPAGGHFTLPEQVASFGGFFNLSPFDQGTGMATFQLYVDNLLVASKTAQFTVQ